MPVLFQNGCAGDVNIGYSADACALGEVMSIRSFETAEEKAQILFKKVVSVLEGDRTDQGDGLYLKQKLVSLPVREDLPTREEARCIDRDLARRIDAETDEEALRDLRIKRMYDQLLLDRMEAVLQEDGTCRPAEFDCVQIGDICFLFVPGELFSKVGLEIKKTFKAKTVIICGYANDYLGYFPTAEALAGGGYEAETSVFAPSLAACIVSALKEWT